MNHLSPIKVLRLIINLKVITTITYQVKKKPEEACNPKRSCTVIEYNIIDVEMVLAFLVRLLIMRSECS